ncbi:hypothetical protein HRbin15_01193 [bacterium HR15]|nr:hypothetical protein HRbin15_01193 [bacterium HR15]
MSQAQSNQSKKISIYKFGPQSLIPWLIEAWERRELSPDTRNNLKQLLREHGLLFSDSDIDIFDLLKSLDYKTLISQLSEGDFASFIESKLDNARIDDLLLGDQSLNCANLRALLLSHFSHFPYPNMGLQIVLDEAIRKAQEAQSACYLYTQFTNPLDFSECIQVIHESIDRALVLLEKFNDILIIFLSEISHELMGFTDNQYSKKLNNSSWNDKIKLAKDISTKILEQLDRCDRISTNYKGYLYQFLYFVNKEISDQLNKIREYRNAVRHPTRTFTSGTALPEVYREQIENLVQALKKLHEGWTKLQQIPLLGVICRAGSDVYGRQEVEIASENKQFVKLVFTDINIYSNITKFEAYLGKICFFMSDINNNNHKLNAILVVPHDDEIVRHLLPQELELDLRILEEHGFLKEEVSIDAET